MPQILGHWLTDRPRRPVPALPLQSAEQGIRFRLMTTRPKSATAPKIGDLKLFELKTICPIIAVRDREGP